MRYAKCIISPRSHSCVWVWVWLNLCVRVWGKSVVPILAEILLGVYIHIRVYVCVNWQQRKVDSSKGDMDMLIWMDVCVCLCVSDVRMHACLRMRTTRGLTAQTLYLACLPFEILRIPQSLFKICRCPARKCISLVTECMHHAYVSTCLCNTESKIVDEIKYLMQSPRGKSHIQFRKQQWDSNTAPAEPDHVIF